MNVKMNKLSSAACGRVLAAGMMWIMVRKFVTRMVVVECRGARAQKDRQERGVGDVRRHSCKFEALRTKH